MTNSEWVGPYTKALKAQWPNVSHEQLVAWHQQVVDKTSDYKQAWTQLYTHALRIAAYTEGKVRARYGMGAMPDEDLMQEASAHVGELLMAWQPAKGKLTTYLVDRLRWHLTKYLAKEANGGVGSRAVRTQHVSLYDLATDTDADITDGEGAGADTAKECPLTYGDTGYTPEGYDDPCYEVEDNALRAASGCLTPREYMFTAALRGWKGKKYTAAQISNAFLVPQVTVQRTLMQAARKLAKETAK
jgi:DNA-directed RNA polymerase specialized sigma24 family protein